MKVVEIIETQVVVFETPDQPSVPTPKFWARDFVEAIANRYRFWEWPQKVADYSPQNGMLFLNGTLRGEFTIEKLGVYNNGIICHAKGIPTEQLERFADDLISFWIQDLALPLKMGGPRAYLTKLELEADITLGAKFKQLAKIGPMIGAAIKSYGQPDTLYEMTQIAFHADLWGTSGVQPPAFIFDRRAAHKFADNRYFSSAPLKTDDHLELLKALETAIT